MAVELFANLALTTVSSGGTTAPAPGTTESWTVASSSTFPAAVSGVSQFHIQEDDPTKQSEIILVTNVSGTTWSVTRGVEGTTPVAHTAGFTVIQTVTNSWLSTVRTTAVALTAADIGAGTFPAGNYTFQGNVTSSTDGTVLGWDAGSNRVGFSKKVGQAGKLAFSPNVSFVITEYVGQTSIDPTNAQTDRLTIAAGGAVTLTSTLAIAGALTGVTTLNTSSTLSENGNRVYSAGNAPPYPVTSVATRTGAVTLTAADIAAGTFPSGANTFQGNLNVQGVIWGQSSAGAGDVLKVGNDATLVDVNASHLFAIESQTDTTRGGLQFGSAGPVLLSSGTALALTGSLTVSSTLGVTGAVTLSGNAAGVTDGTWFGWDSSSPPRMGFSKKAAQYPKLAYGGSSANFVITEYVGQASIDPANTQTDRLTIASGGAVTLTSSLAIAGALTGVTTLNTSSTLSENGNRVYSAGNAPPYPVTSVAGRTGGVTLTAADILAGTFPGSTYTASGTWTYTGGIVMNATNAGIELGNPGTANGPYLDFHSGTTAANDYDVRVQATGGSTSAGLGTLTVTAAALTTSGTFNSTGNLSENGNRVYSSGNANLASATPAAVASAGAVGAGTDFARGNHVHAGVATLTGTAGQIGVSASTGAVTLTNLGVTSIVAGTNISISGATGAVTINASGGGAVSSVAGRTGAVTLTAADIAAGAFPAGAFSFTGNVSTTTNFAAQAASSGSALLNTGDATHSGYVAFYNTPLSANRQGYIGYSSTSAGADAGTINYVAGAHQFSGSLNTSSTLSENGNRVYNSANPPPYPVSSVASRTGAVTLTAADIAPGTFSASGQYVFPNGTWVAVQGVALDLSSANGTTGALGAGVGDKLALYGTSFGFGVQSNRLVAYLPSTASFAVRQNSLSGNASSGTEVFTVSGTGAVGASGLITASAGVSVPSGQPFTVGPKKTYSGTLALPATTGTATVLGQFSSTAGAMALRLHLHLVTGSVTRTKTYEVVVDTATDSTNTYYKLLPADQSTAQSAGNDVALEIYRPSTATTTWQIWVRNSATVFASTGALTWSAESYGDAVVTYAAALSPATGASGGAVSTLHPSNALDTVAGNVGIGTDTPGALLDVRGTLALTGDQTITKNAAKIALTDGTRNAVVGLATATNDIATSSVAGDLVLGSGTSPAYGGRVFVPGSVAVGGTMNAVGDLQVLGVSQPRGVIARATPITANTTLGAAGAEITLISLNANVIAGRKYRVVALYPSVTSTVTADDIVVRIYAGATLMQNSGRIRITAAALGFSGGPVEATYSAASTVTGTFSLRMIRVAGTGTGTANAGATTPIEFYVEDVGTV